MVTIGFLVCGFCRYETQIAVALRGSFAREDAPASLVTVACQCVGHAFARGVVPSSQKRLVDVLAQVYFALSRP